MTYDVYLYTGDKNLVGFLAESEVVVTYEGKKGCLNWDNYGLTLFFEDCHSSLETEKYQVRISAAKFGAFRYPDIVEPVGKSFYIESSVPLKTSVTIRIQHNVPEKDIQHLCFVTSSDNQPPYDYSILYEGNFTSTHGEIVVRRFSLYSIGRLLTKYHVKGILSLLEKTYEASLFRSTLPKIDLCGYKWNIYVSVVKNCSIFRRSVERYIKEEYKDEVELVARNVVRLTMNNSDVTAISSHESCRHMEWSLKPSEYPSMKKIDINSYVDACPPHIKFVLRVKTPLRGSFPNVRFTLIGLQEPENILNLDNFIPQSKQQKLIQLSYN